MTKKERRIAILKDVLKQLKTEAYVPMKNNYVKLPKELRDNLMYNGDLDAKTQLLACAKACKVCAKGSIFLSTVRKENQVKMADLHWAEHNKSNKGTQRVINLFGKANLDKIEATFEKWPYFVPGGFIGSSYYTPNNEDDSRVKNKEIAAFIKKFPDKKERLVAIIRNAIRNEGIFKP